MTIFCIQCAMRAMVEDRPYEPSDEDTIEAHMEAHHPDPVATYRERQALEQLLVEKRMGRRSDVKH